MRELLKRQFSPRGRVGRLGFLAVFGFQVFWVGVVVVMVLLTDAGVLSKEVADWIGRVAIIAYLAGWWPLIASMIKRLHDIGLSAWWLIALFTPAGPLVLLFLALYPGSKGDNRFGTPNGPSLASPVPIEAN